MTTTPTTPSARDAAYHFHSYTNALTHLETGPFILVRGEGCYVYDDAGNRYLEAMAGLWSTALGFSEQRLVDAAHEQMKALPYMHNFAARSHNPAIDLAEKLISLAPVPMSKVFFTNSGSEANDTVMKMLWYRANSMGEPNRKKFISRINGYHGITIASASLTGIPTNHVSFDLPLPQVKHTGKPHFWREGKPGETEQDFSTRMAAELEALIQEEGPETISAMFAEPVMGAGGVIVPPEGYWEKIQAVLNKHDILLVADEVICGFGRTGQLFGCMTYGIKPDVMVMSKQLTSTYFPMSAVMMNDKVFVPIRDESNRVGVLAHGFTGAGHPVGAAIAKENIAIIEERGLVAQGAETGKYLQAQLRNFSDHPLVGEVRGVGMIAAVELVADKTSKAPHGELGRLGGLAQNAMQRHGVISRAMKDALAFCPPMISEKAEVDLIVSALTKSLDDVQAQIKVSA